MKKILVPTDFSETANKARDYAIQLAQLIDAEIILFNTFHIPYSGASAGTLINLDKIALEESEKAMELQLEYVNSNYANVKFTTLCRAGLLVDSVKNISNNNEVDLIVMGTTGADGVVENLLGSNTSALIGLIKTPIITVPKDATINFPKHIVVANDLMESGEEELFDVLRKIAIDTYSSIDFLFIVKDENQVENKIQRLKSADFDNNFDSQYHPFHFKDSENIEDGILDYIESKDFDLLVVVSHQRTFWEGLFHKSISKALVKHAKMPILVLPD
jgi:nucleotide-binding universal stress UspA family protein